jgi:hypothetical protein
MTATTPTISALASEAYGWFERLQRSQDEVLWKTKDGAPGWVRDLVHEAHGTMFPDDWRYDAIHSALSHIGDMDAEDVSGLTDEDHVFCDGNVDTYNGARTQWLASNLERAGYCDEAASEFGYDPESGIFNLIGLGQYQESAEVWASVVESLSEHQEAIELELVDEDDA